MKYLTLSIFLLLFLADDTLAQPRKPFQNPRKVREEERKNTIPRREPKYAPGHAPSDNYKLRNRFFIRWEPSALAPLPVKEVKLGGEYCFGGKWGVGLMGGPVLNSARTGSGFALHPEVRIYFGFQRGRGLVSVAGQYRRQTTGAYSGPLYESWYQSWYSQSSAVMNVWGIDGSAGFSAKLVGPLHFEMHGGLGVKLVDYDRKDLTGGGYKDRGVAFLFEDIVLNKATLPYFFIRLNLSWLVGPAIRNR